jgi:predicted anti-sigma-YlaC factor YlaD
MMRCDKSRELILTDHIDGCLKEEHQAGFEAHLADCKACREFMALAERDLVMPFKGLEREPMPPSVARSVIARLQDEQGAREERARGSLWEKFIDLVLPPMPVMRVTAGMLACLIVAGVGFRVSGLQQERQEQRGIFMAQVAGFSAGNDTASADYGTTMETVFLKERGES